MAVINPGIDFGSTGLRAAYSLPGEPVRVVALADAEWPWVLCEPASDGPLPVSFPSVKSKLGLVSAVGTGTGSVAPAEIVANALNTLRERIVAETSASIGQTVISVPARFFSVQRTALLEAAQKAGLGKVRLLTDSVAAVIAHTGGKGTGTFLVYGMGYGGYELGLVRAVRGRYRVLGYAGASTPGGGTFDEHVLHGCLAVLRQHGTLPDEVRHGDIGWLRLRDKTEKVKEHVVYGPVLFPLSVPGPDGDQRLAVQVDQEQFDVLTRHLVARTLDRTDTLFEQAGLNREDVETVLLVGGSTRIPQLRKLASRLGGNIVATGPEQIAHGTALHANQLMGHSAFSDEEYGGATSVEPTESLLEAPPLAATVLTAPGSTPSVGPDAMTGLDRARRLIEEGRSDDAESELHRLIGGAQELLGQIAASRSREVASSPSANQGSPGATSADPLLVGARRRFEKGRYQEAINMAHQAWQREPDRPDVFNAMIDIHCDAAMANPTLTEFARDETWLRCALQHDPSNARIRGLLAERIFMHGKDLHRTGRKDEARRAFQYALTWDPEHKAAEDLLHRLGRRR